jgi:hypothetical protein
MLCTHFFYSFAQVHAHEVFVDGCFNGDPHPGTFRRGAPFLFGSSRTLVHLFVTHASQATFCFFLTADWV